MYRLNIPVPPEEYFPEVIVAQRMGDGFEKEYVEYEPRWQSDKGRRTVVVDEKCFYAMADTSERFKAENAKLRELCEDMLDYVEIRAAFGRPPTSEMYERFADAARELGIEVDGWVNDQATE